MSSQARLVIRNKSDVIKKNFKMAEIVKAVRKELESEDPFEDRAAVNWVILSSRYLSDT